MSMLNPMPSQELKSLRGLKKKDRETSAFKAFARALGPRASSSHQLVLLVHKSLEKRRVNTLTTQTAAP